MKLPIRFCLGRKHSFVVRIAGEKYEKHSFDPLIQKLKILEKNANLERGTRRSPFSILLAPYK